MFKEFFKSGLSLAKLKEGCYETTLKGAAYVEADLVKNPAAKDYVRLDLQLSDRIINDNRFEQGFSIFLSHIKQQLGWQYQNIAVQDLLESLKETSFKIWISFQTADDGTGRVFQNINYLPPVTTTTVVDEEVTVTVSRKGNKATVTKAEDAPF